MLTPETAHTHRYKNRRDTWRVEVIGVGGVKRANIEDLNSSLKLSVFCVDIQQTPLTFLSNLPYACRCGIIMRTSWPGVWMNDKWLWTFDYNIDSSQYCVIYYGYSWEFYIEWWGSYWTTRPLIHTHRVNYGFRMVQVVQSIPDYVFRSSISIVHSLSFHHCSLIISMLLT